MAERSSLHAQRRGVKLISAPLFINARQHCARRPFRQSKKARRSLVLTLMGYPPPTETYRNLP
jgi:hypothetical protein